MKKNRIKRKHKQKRRKLIAIAGITLSIIIILSGVFYYNKSFFLKRENLYNTSSYCCNSDSILNSYKVITIVINLHTKDSHKNKLF
jgi:hypothetical protein